MLSIAGVLAVLFIGFQLSLPFLLARLFRYGARIERMENSLEALHRRLDAIDPTGTVQPTSSVTAPDAPPSPAPETSSTDPTETRHGVASPENGEPREASQGDSGFEETASPDGESSGAVPSIPVVENQSVPSELPHSSEVDSGGASLEERLGTKWAVYLGGIAIALGGVFLVRHAIEAGLLGPTTRVVLGGLLGIALVAAGTRMRMRDVDLAFGAIGGAHVPSVLTAAGTVVLFASVYAAHALYGLIGPAAAFTMLGAIALGTMASALLQGPSLAGLGLAGAFVTPALVASSAPNPWPLVIYLTVVSLAALGLARIRAWRWLACAALAGVAIWAVLILGKAQGNELWRLPAMIYVLVQTAIAAFVLAVAPHFGSRDEDVQVDLVATVATGVMTGVAILALMLVPHEHWFHVTFAVLMVALLGVVGSTVMASAAALAFAGIVVGAKLIVWPAIDLSPTSSHFYGGLTQLVRFPDGVVAFISFAAITALGLTAAGALTLWRRSQLPATIAGLVALGAVLAPLLALTIAYLRVTEFGTAISFTLAGSVLAFGFATSSELFNRRSLERSDDNEAIALRIATGVFAAAAIGAIAIALVAGLQRGYLTIAFALAAAGTAYVADRKRIPLLRYAVGALSFVVLARVVWDPRIMGADIGSTPILNWLLVGYGVPAVCFVMASRYLRHHRVDVVSHVADALAILFAALFGIFQIRHFINGGDPLATTTDHVELGLQAVLMMGLSYALAHLIARRRSEVFEAAHTAASVIGAVVVLLGLGVLHNPILTNETVGGSVPFSTLMPAYLAPGLMALYIARHARGLRPDYYVLGAACFALALIFGYVTLETRHAFHGAEIGNMFRYFSSEILAYNVIWLLLAIAFLAYGLIRESLPARAASGLLLVVTTIKVGVFDLAGITGIWRALSFLCLGGVLIAIGMIYQRLVFQSRRSVSEQPTSD